MQRARVKFRQRFRNRNWKLKCNPYKVRYQKKQPLWERNGRHDQSWRELIKLYYRVATYRGILNFCVIIRWINWTIVCFHRLAISLHFYHRSKGFPQTQTKDKKRLAIMSFTKNDYTYVFEELRPGDKRKDEKERILLRVDQERIDYT